MMSQPKSKACNKAVNAALIWKHYTDVSRETIDHVMSLQEINSVIRAKNTFILKLQ